MNGFRTLFLQDLACTLTSKPFQYGSSCQLHTGSSCRRFWNFFDFPKMEESLSRIEKSSKDLRIPLASAPREPVATSTGSPVAGNVRRLPSTSFGFDGNTPVYRATCKFHKPFAKRKVEETSLLDGNPVPRNLKLKLQGYKMLESEFAGFEMARLGEERTTEDVFEIRADSKMRENSIQSRSPTKEAERDARETACKDESLNLAQQPRLSGESKDGTVPLHSQAPRPPSIPPPPCCPPPSQAPSPPPDPQCPSREPRCPSKTPAESWAPPNSHPEKPTCPSPCPRTCTTTPCQSATVRQGAGQDCEGPWPGSGPSTLLGTASQSPPSLAVSFPKEPLCPLSPAVPAAPTSCAGGARIPSASVAMPSLRLKESRTSLNSIASGRSVSGLSSIGSVGVLTNSSGQSALPRTARSLPGLPRESKKASAACTAKSQSSCSARDDCPKSKIKSKSKRKEPSCKKKVDRCKRKGCFDDEKDSLCTNKAECPERKRPRKKKSRKTKKTCCARVSKPPERKSKCKERARGRSSCGSTAPAACPGGSTDETCSTKKPQCPARKKRKSRKGSSCTRERDGCKRTRERSCGSSKSSAKRRAKSEEKRSRSPCSLRRAPCSKEKRKSTCKAYVCPGNVGPETCSTNKPQCPRRKKKSASKRRKRSCSRRSDKSCAPGRRGSCDSRSFCTHVPRRLSPVLGRFYGRDVNAGKDDVKCGEDIFARKYPKPGPKCKRSSSEGERDGSCQRGTRTLSCEEGKGKKSRVKSTSAKKDDVQSVKDQLAKEREEVKRCKEGSRKRTTSEARKQSCASEKATKVKEDAGSKDSAGKAKTGVERVISPCKLKKAGLCKDTKSSKNKAKEKEKKKGGGKRCSASASDVECIVRYAPKQLLEATTSHVELLRKYSGGSCRIESSKDTSLRIPGSHERPVLKDDQSSTQNVDF